MAKPKDFGPGLPKNVARVAVGIDQSYSGFGVTFMDMDSDAYFTTVFKGEGVGVDRLVDISLKLGNLLEKFVMDSPKKEVVVAMEGYAFGSQMANMAGELGATVKLLLRDFVHGYHGAYPYIIPPTTLKKYVTGKGSGVQKNQMLLHVFKKWNVEFNDDNAADSYALAHIASGKAELAYEKEIYTKIHQPNFREK